MAEEENYNRFAEIWTRINGSESRVLHHGSRWLASVITMICIYALAVFSYPSTVLGA